LFWGFFTGREKRAKHTLDRVPTAMGREEGGRGWKPPVAQQPTHLKKASRNGRADEAFSNR